MQTTSYFSHHLASTMAGSCSKGFSDGPLLSASFNGPCALEQLANGVVIISDSMNNCLRLIDLDSGSVSTLDITTVSGFQTSVLAPRGLCKIVINGVNGVLLSDSGHNRLVFINGETGHFDHLAGTGEAAHVDGGFSHAAFNSPHSVVSDPVNGIIYLTDTKNHCIRTLSLATKKVRTLAGTPGVFGYKDGLTPLFNEPLGIVLTEDGNIIVCDSKNGALRYVSRENGETITLVGKPSNNIFQTNCTYSYKNSIANRQYLSKRRTDIGNYFSFRFELPYDLIFVDDILLVSDAGSGRLYALDHRFEMLHCLNDQAPGQGYLDSPLRTSMFKAPSGLCKCGDIILIADMDSNCIRAIMQALTKTYQGSSDCLQGIHSIHGKTTNVRASSNESSRTQQSFANTMHGSIGLQSKTMTPGPVGKLSRTADGSNIDSSDTLVALTEPSALQHTTLAYNLEEELSRDRAQTPSCVNEFLDDPYPIALFNLEVYNMLLKYFLAKSTPSVIDRPSHRSTDKPAPARAASNLAMSTRSVPTKISGSSRTTGESSINVLLHNHEYSMQSIVEVCTVLSSRIFDMSNQVYSNYGKRLAKYLSTFNPIIFMSELTIDGKEHYILEHSKKGLLRGLTMATNVPVFSCNLSSEDNLRIEYLIITGMKNARVFVIEPKMASFFIDLDVSFLVDSLFLRCFNTAELLFHCYSSKQSMVGIDEADVQKNAVYLDGLSQEKDKRDRDVVSTATTSSINTGSKANRLKVVKTDIVNESLMNVSNAVLTSDGEDTCQEGAESFESDSTIFTTFDPIQKPQDALTEIMSLSIETKSFSSATCGLFDYSPYHSVGEYSTRILINTGLGDDDRSFCVIPISQALFNKRYGITARDSLCYEVIVYFSIIGHQVVRGSKEKISTDKIKLCDYVEFRIPYMITRSSAAFKKYANKVTEVQEASGLSREVKRLERNIIFGVGCTKEGSACSGKPLRDKIIETHD